MNDRFNNDQHNFYEGRRRTDFPRQDQNENSTSTNSNNNNREEYASEISPTTPVGRNNWDTTDHRNDRPEGTTDVERSDADTADNSVGRTIGYVGVGLGIASLFLWSIVLGPLAAVLGFYAYSQGSKTSGAWAIGLGIVATLSYFFLIPFSR